MDASAELKTRIKAAMFFARARRFAAVLLWCAGAAGALAGGLLLSGIPPRPEWTGFLAAAAVLVSFVAAALPLRRYSVETELDAGTGAGGAIMALATPECSESLLRGEVEAKALEALRRRSILSAMRMRLAAPLSVALFGLFLAGVASLASRTGPDEVEILAALVERAAQAGAAAANAEAETGNENEAARKLAQSIARDWREGRKALALAKLNELLKRARVRLNAARLEREKKLRDAGLPPELARALAEGKSGNLSLRGGVSAEALERAAAKVGGEIGASLAKAARFEAGSAEQLRALREALAAAKRLRLEEDEYLGELDRAARSGAEMAADLTQNQKSELERLLKKGKLSASARPGDTELLRKAVASHAFPVEYRTILIKYALKGATK